LYRVSFFSLLFILCVLALPVVNPSNTGTTAQKLTNDLLRGLYDQDCLASHSISGLINSKKGPSKPALPEDQIQAILSKAITSTARLLILSQCL
jgi:hypothetical protein